MANELRILILDDTPTDAELMEYELRKSGLVFTSQRVDTRDAFIQALDEFRPDIVLADYSLPDFDGLSALKIVQHHDPDMPTIMVTGALSDVQAVELLKEGARDYVLKSGLARLPSAIRKVVLEERDVRARKEAEKALRESEELFRSVALNASDAIVVIRGPDGVVDIWNKKAEEMFGYAASEAVGKVAHRFIVPDPYREKAGIGVKRFFETGEGDVIGKTLVLFALRRDGSEFPVELSISSMKVGDEWRATAIVRDVTERKKMEADLRDSEEKYRQFFTAESDAIILIDGETKRFVDANGAALNLFQYTREEFLNLGAMNISAEPEETKAVFEKLDRGGIVRVQLRYLKKKDGAVFPTEAFAGSFMLKGRKVFFEVFRDITQRMEDERKLKFAETQLMLSEKLAGIGQLSAGVCHEILNPLNIISIQTQLLLKREEGNPGLTERLTKIMGEIGRINKIVGSLMTFARKGFPELKPVQINAELDAALSLVEKDFSLDNIKIGRDYQSPLPEIKIDTDEMRQVFLNLINNARYEMRGGGTLTVKTRLEKVGDRDHVRICFCDTGSGIKKEHLTKIFNPFFTTKPEGKGTGMGLSMAHSIVEKHGGTIIAESEEGKGAAFIIGLPLDT